MSSTPVLTAIDASGAVVDDTPLRVGASTGRWTLMAIVNTDAGRAAVLEDFSDLRGDILVLDESGVVARFPKSLEDGAASATGLYRGHALEAVLDSDRDVLARDLLAQSGDPKFADVAACLPPIDRMLTYTFLGSTLGFDKIALGYGGRTATFDPAVFVPAIHQIRADKAVADGLVGGWLPVARFVYPEAGGAWSEMLAFAPPRLVNGNPWAQPAWYRVARVENGRLAWIKYFDSYIPFPPHDDQPPDRFFGDLLATRDAFGAELAGSMSIAVPDARIGDMARHGLVRSMITRLGDWPKYGVVDRNYGGSEHDGFPDTFNTDVAALCDWGLFERAGRYIDNYFGSFVRDDGSLLYRGPETGQYGRMLTVVAQYVAQGGDPAVVLRHRGRIDAIADLLLALREKGLALAADNPAYGLIAAWIEADSALDPDPARYMQPYFGNCTEAARGWRDLARCWRGLGYAERAATLDAAARSLEADIQRAVERSILRDTTPPCLPSIAGATEPPHIAVANDRLDPQHRGYRSFMEMLYSGNLASEQVRLVVDYRAGRRDTILGLPTAYGYNTHEVAGFLTYGHAYGLVQHDFIREFLLTLYSLMAHQHTRGTWTAPETRSLNPGVNAAPYCVPAQLVVPMLTRWMLAFEDPAADLLWMAKGTPRDWLEDGLTIEVANAPTRWGRVSFSIVSHLAECYIEATVDFESRTVPPTLRLRLRAPSGYQLARCLVDGSAWDQFDPALETIDLVPTSSSRIVVRAQFSTDRAAGA